MLGICWESWVVECDLGYDAMHGRVNKMAAINFSYTRMCMLDIHDLAGYVFSVDYIYTTAQSELFQSVTT